MVARWRGMTSLAAMVLLLAVSVSLVWSTQEIQNASRTLDRTEARVTARASILRALADLFRGLQSEWNPDSQPWYEYADGFVASNGLVVSATDLSGRLNLNNVHRFLWEHSPLGSALSTQGVESFLSHRIKEGPFVDEQGYEAFVAPRPLAEWFTVLPVFSLSTVDEDVFRVVLERRTNQPGLVSSWVRKLSELRTSHLVLQPNDVDSVFGADANAIREYFPVGPELNAQTAPEGLLLALFQSSDLAIPEPQRKVEAIVAARGKGQLTAAKLRSEVNLPPGHRIWAYLGTESRFMHVVVSTASLTMDFVVWRQGSSPSEKFRLLRQEERSR